MNKKNYIKPALKAFEVKSAPLCASNEIHIGNENQNLDSKSFSGGLIDDEFDDGFNNEDTESLF